MPALRPRSRSRGIGGTYLFQQTAVLGLADSGSDNQAVTYRASPGASPIFSSLVQVSGWSVYLGPVMQAPLPAGLSHVRYLQDADEAWMERSATLAFVADEEGNCIECTWDSSSTTMTIGSPTMR